MHESHESTSNFRNFLSKYQETLNSLLRSDIEAQTRRILEALQKNTMPIGILGVGASFILAQKISHHFRSFGIPAFSFQMDDVLHGDLGLILNDSIVFLLSKKILVTTNVRSVIHVGGLIWKISSKILNRMT